MDMNAYERHMKEMTQPMRDEMEAYGFTQLETAEAVHETMDGLQGTALIMINSVCGCAAGLARPAVRESLAKVEVKPNHLLTVFAGQDREATEAMRSYFEEVPPSSPSIAVWKDGALAYFIPREQIEDFEMEQIEGHLTSVLNQFNA